jgi:hypothetical protein
MNFGCVMYPSQAQDEHREMTAKECEEEEDGCSLVVSDQTTSKYNQRAP